MATATPEEVLKSVSRDLRQRGYSHAYVAGILSYRSPQSVTNLLASKKYLSPKIAKKFAEKFSYNIPFLTSGEGSLLSENDSSIMRYWTQMELYVAKSQLLTEASFVVLEAWHKGIPFGSIPEIDCIVHLSSRLNKIKDSDSMVRLYNEVLEDISRARVKMQDYEK